MFDTPEEIDQEIDKLDGLRNSIMGQANIAVGRILGKIELLEQIKADLAKPEVSEEQKPAVPVES